MAEPTSSPQKEETEGKKLSFLNKILEKEKAKRSRPDSDEKLQDTDSEDEGPRTRGGGGKGSSNKKAKTSTDKVKEEPTVPRKGNIPRRSKDDSSDGNKNEATTDEKKKPGTSSLIQSMGPSLTPVASQAGSTRGNAVRSTVGRPNKGSSSMEMTPKKPRPNVSSTGTPSKTEMGMTGTSNISSPPPSQQPPQSSSQQQQSTSSSQQQISLAEKQQQQQINLAEKQQQQQIKLQRQKNQHMVKSLEGICTSLLDNTHFQLILNSGMSNSYNVGGNIDLSGSFSRDEKDMYDYFDLNKDGEIVVPPKIAIFPEEFPPGMKERSLHWWGIVDPAVGARSSSNSRSNPHDISHSSGAGANIRKERTDEQRVGSGGGGDQHRRGNDRGRPPPMMHGPPPPPGRGPPDLGPPGPYPPGPPPPPAWGRPPRDMPPPFWDGPPRGGGPDGPPRGGPDGPPPPFWDDRRGGGRGRGPPGPNDRDRDRNRNRGPPPGQRGRR